MFEELTEMDKRSIEELNKQNRWSMGYNELVELVKEHRDTDNNHTKQVIEYRLEDINFHHEVSMLRRGQYAELLEEIEEEFTLSF